MRCRRPVIYERHPGAAAKPLPARYARHEPEKTVLYQLVREQLPTLLAETDARAAEGEGGLPRFVRRELEDYLACGVLARGFARVRCEACGDEILCAFSCKGRGICPSCTARRMHETALHLVDRVVPRVPVRQWVLTYPFLMRLALAYDAKLLSAALTIFIRVLFAWQRRRARRLGHRASAVAPASVTFVQRFGSALQLTPHLHVLLPDGVFLDEPGREGERPRFVHLEPPTDEEVDGLLARVAERTHALLVRRGHLAEPGLEEAGQATAADPHLAEAMVVPRSVRPPASSSLGLGPPPRTAIRDGFSLHADRLVAKDDRQGLEQLIRYGLRPAVALDRLSRDDEGLVHYRLKRTFSDGTREVVLSPRALLRRLCALVPAPRAHLTRYHGAFSSHARLRARITGHGSVPGRRAKTRAPSGASLSPPASDGDGPASAAADGAAGAAADGASPGVPMRPRYLPWAELLRRVHQVEVTVCSRCGGRRRVLAFISDLQVARRILVHLGLPSELPSLAAPRAPPEPPEFGGWSDDDFADPPSPTD